jgi:ligand-binding sensor domain-containing protein/serine phosphatase RsbU (regulator of sigma subunit)
MRIFRLIVTLVFVLSVPGWMDYRVKQFEHLSTEQGLSQNIVVSIMQDSRGLMWFGTDDGLNMYDGYRFRPFHHRRDDPHSLSHDRAWRVLEDRHGVIWVGTMGGGLNRFNRKDGTFTHYKAEPDKPGGLKGNTIWFIYEDSGGRFWVGTSYNGLHLFDREKETFTVFQPEPGAADVAGSRFVTCIYEDKRGNLWVGTHGGLFRCDVDKKTLVLYKNRWADTSRAFHSRVNAVLEDRAGVLWIGTFRGLYTLDRETREFSPYKNKNPHHRDLFNNSVEALLEDSTGDLWVGTFGGLYKLNRKRDRSYEFKTGHPNAENFRSNIILYLYEDRSGILWIGTYSGISKYDRKRETFSYYRIQVEKAGGVKEKLGAWTILEDESGKLWLGSFTHGLTRFDRETGEVTAYKLDTDARGVTGAVSSLRFDRDGAIWVGTNRTGLFRFNPVNGDKVHYIHNPAQQGSISSNEVVTVYRDGKDNLWAGTENGLNRFYRSTGTFKSYRRQENNPGSISSNRVYDILEGRAGGIWVGTYGGGLNRLDPATGTFTRYGYPGSDPTSLSNNKIYCIHEDQTGILWLGTNNGGLDRFDPGTGTFTNFSKEDGLPNNVIFGILEDAEGNLWLSSNLGISRFNPITKVFKNFRLSDGLQGYEFLSSSCFKNKKGEMFFGGVNGFNAFFPERIGENTHIPPVVITGFKIFNRPVPVAEDSPLKAPITEVDHIELSHGDSTFSFEFAALDYTDPAKNRYKYKMEGYDKDWIELGNKHDITFTNLPPGEYVFKVQGSNNDGWWNEAGASLKVTITPSFWQTWLFQLGLLAIILAAIIFIYRGRLKHVKMKTELKTAHDAQMSIMPQTSPRVKGLDIYGVCRPAYSVGGDFFDYIEPGQDENKIYIAVGDVSGKAMDSAMTAVMTSGMVHSKASDSLSVSRILNHVNQLVHLKTSKKVFTALCLASIDTAGQEMVFTNAGLPEPVLKRDNAIQFLRSEGSRLPLGASRGTFYGERFVSLKPGDMLVFYTDGVTDAMTAAGQYYGAINLANLLAETPTSGLSARRVVEIIIENVVKFSEGMDPHDDITVAVVKVS